MASVNYFAVIVEFTDEHGEKHKVWDAVDNRAVDHFYQALGNEENVELIYTPKVPKLSILVMKIPFQSITW